LIASEGRCRTEQLPARCGCPGVGRCSPGRRPGREGNRDGVARLGWTGERLVRSRLSRGRPGMGRWDIGAHVPAGIAVSGDLVSPTPSRRARCACGPASRRTPRGGRGASGPCDRWPTRLRSRVWVRASMCRSPGCHRRGCVGGTGRLDGLPGGLRIKRQRSAERIAGAARRLERIGRWLIGSSDQPGRSRGGLDGLGLSDDQDAPYRYGFRATDAGTGGFLLLTSDTPGFQPQPRGETIRLSAPGKRLLDRVEYGPQ